MGIPVLILGESGSGKSASLRNFKESEVGIINVGKKPLPFKTKLKPFKTKSVVIDDAQYLMANEFMRQAKTTGFQKFTDIALNFWTLVQIVVDELPEDKIVYFLGHIERDGNGNEKFKTVGKMLDEKITIEGLFTIVLKTYVKDVEEQIIDNDLKMVDDTIRDYYELNKKETK